MDKKLVGQALTKFALGLALMGLLIFLPAGTLQYWQGWLLMGILFVPMFIAGLVMMAKAPELLRKRLEAREQEGEQRTVIALSGLMFLVGFILAGLDFRFRWLVLPAWVPIAAAVLFLLGYLLFGEVLRENSYLARTIEVQEGQRVIDTGLYGAVRHPMYAATILMFLAMPLVLGSLIAFPVFLCYLPIIAKRMRNEEKVLEEGLPGYRDYEKKVRYRVIPFLW
ncbi:MAG: isoprenylcysteine carboxylmethyltransferase family protein [Oscillospiraceae bacterium]|nr:isoprenylcysteine carboxylmethyltransferase family protein [Oscillospiraceae bacterium]